MNPKRILVIDDEPVYTEMVRMSLEQVGGYVVGEENDPRQALETVRSFQPDLVLLDIMMPHLDGGDVASLIADHPDTRHIPVVFVTALVSPSEARNGLQPPVGAPNGHRYVSKPSSIDDLIDAIESGLAQANSSAA